MSTDLATLTKLDPAALVVWVKGRIEEAADALEVRKIKATVAGLAAFQRAVQAGKEAQQGCVEATVRCDRRLQQELKKLEKNKGGRPRKTPAGVAGVFGAATLEELGFDNKQTHKNAVLAQVTPEQFEAGITALRERGELTQEAMRGLMSQAIAGGLGPEAIKASIKAERARRPEPEPLRLRPDLDLSPAGAAIFDLEGNDLWTFDPADCARRLQPALRPRMKARAEVCADWLARFVIAVEGLEQDGGEAAQDDNARGQAA